jgi:hypothetical protein
VALGAYSLSYIFQSKNIISSIPISLILLPPLDHPLLPLNAQLSLLLLLPSAFALVLALLPLFVLLSLLESSYFALLNRIEFVLDDNAFVYAIEAAAGAGEDHEAAPVEPN